MDPSPPTGEPHPEPSRGGGARARRGRGPIAVVARGLVVLAVLLAALVGLAHVLAARHLAVLQPNATWTGEIDFRRAGRLDFVLAVPDDAVLVRVELRCEGAELDLYANPDAAIDDVADAADAITESGAERVLVLDGLGAEPLAGARWYFTALWPYASAPLDHGRRLERSSATVTVTTFRARVDAELVAGEPLRSQLDEESGGFRTFRVSVPADARALRVDLFEVSSDLDLFARAGSQILASDESVASAENGWGHETLVIDAASRPALATGDWYIDVVDAVGPTRTLGFSILVGFDAGEIGRAHV